VAPDEQKSDVPESPKSPAVDGHVLAEELAHQVQIALEKDPHRATLQSKRFLLDLHSLCTRLESSFSTYRQVVLKMAEAESALSQVLLEESGMSESRSGDPSKPGAEMGDNTSEPVDETSLAGQSSLHKMDPAISNALSEFGTVTK
jgi:hypothetical protein